eukprot:TRINITY_DN10601_c0_g3_i1.p2 TRINITY_DN10601_c0_g3~~TRINITY_DN10601_c0_g3_i1.p2  ORF type:complete len:273 (+),score=60.78 TRINITY_DN10601_c0_g3_i1:84-902(+)
MGPTHYELLRVPCDASAAAVRRAFHKECIKYHPDKAGKAGELHFKVLVAAYDTLRDAQSRRAYDASLPAPIPRPRPSPPARPSPRGSSSAGEHSPRRPSPEEGEDPRRAERRRARKGSRWCDSCCCWVSGSWQAHAKGRRHCPRAKRRRKDPDPQRHPFDLGSDLHHADASGASSAEDDEDDEVLADAIERILRANGVRCAPRQGSDAPGAGAAPQPRGAAPRSPPAARSSEATATAAASPASASAAAAEAGAAKRSAEVLQMWSSLSRGGQ